MQGPTQSPAVRRLLLIATCVVAAGLWAAVAQATIYKYVDREGVTHYSDSVSSIPDAYRDQVRDITDEMQKMDGFRVVGGVEGGAASSDDESDVWGTDELDSNADLSGLDFAGADVASGLIESMGFGIVLLFLVAVPVLWVVTALVFKLSCRMAGEDPPGLGRACGILLAQGFCGTAVGGVVGGIGAALGIDDATSIAGAVAVGGASTLLSWLANGGILASMMGYGFVKSLWIDILHTLLVMVMIGVPVGLIAAVVMMAG